ncbi:hypothetical protein [Microbacterium sp. PMB16]|uniref:hypothetical protein n=1 Tax=Microbacterium sp. PMB16 TaxID=3120157 RepID=UPI003F4C5D53
MSDHNIELTLSSAEALVLFEWLASAHDAESLTADEAERRVLWDLESQLETRVVEVFDPDYLEEVAQAKRVVLAS